MQTDIFYINQKSEHIFTVMNSDPKIKNLKKFKPRQKNEFTVYVFNNLYLIINNKNKSKICERIENVDTVVNDDYMFIESTVTKMPQESFPIINLYDNIIKRTITIYENNICLVEDTDKDGTISFLRVENDINITNQLFDKLN